MKIVSIIPARGGSKRVLNKNVKLINGLPLITYVIRASKGCTLIAETWVSTNNSNIAYVADACGCKIIHRPEHLCSDTSTSEEALLHFAEYVDFDILVFMQATSPLTLSYDLEKGLNSIMHGNADSVLSVCEDVRFYWNKDKTPINYDPLNRPRSQDKEKIYKETGAFYITTREALLKSKCRISGITDFVIVPESRSFEIDTEEDFAITEAILKSQNLTS